jgi:hypothetical protein
MKHIETTDGINWKQLNNVVLTQEQRDILKSPETQAAKDLRAQLNEGRYTVLSTEQSATVQAKYAELKPELKETDIYQLIAVSMILEDDGTIQSGIINCRVNGNHQQIRF